MSVQWRLKQDKVSVKSIQFSMTTVHTLVRSSLHRYMWTYIQTDGRTEYQTNGRTEDKTTSTMIYNHKTHRQTSRRNWLMNKRTSKTRWHAHMYAQCRCGHYYVPTTFGIHASKLVVRPTVNINSFLVSRMLQSEQPDILHNTYHLHIL